MESGSAVASLKLWNHLLLQIKTSPTSLNLRKDTAALFYSAVPHSCCFYMCLWVTWPDTTSWMAPVLKKEEKLPRVQKKQLVVGAEGDALRKLLLQTLCSCWLHASNYNGRCCKAANGAVTYRWLAERCFIMIGSAAVRPREHSVVSSVSSHSLLVLFQCCLRSSTHFKRLENQSSGSFTNRRLGHLRWEVVKERDPNQERWKQRKIQKASTAGQPGKAESPTQAENTEEEQKRRLQR